MAAGAESSLTRPHAAPGAAAVMMQRASWWMRARAWARLAYTDIGSKEHHVLLEWIIWAVIVSVVITVLQHDHALDVQYHVLFKVTESIVLVAFAADYALNVYYARHRRRYIFSLAGIVDLLAILPSLLLFVEFSSIKMLRSLRFLRFLRLLLVVRAVRDRARAAGHEEQPSLVLDLQLSVIFISALLLLVPDDALRNVLLGITLIIAVSVGLRRWLVAHQRLTLSVGVLVASLVGAMLYAIHLDTQGQAGWAVGLLFGAVASALVTWWRVEAPAGAL